MTFAEKFGTDGLRRTRGLLGWLGAYDSSHHPRREHDRRSRFVVDLHALVEKATSNLGRTQREGHDRFDQVAYQVLRERTQDEAIELELLLLYVLRESVADQIGILDQLSRELDQRAEMLVGGTKCTLNPIAADKSVPPMKRRARHPRTGTCEPRVA